MKEMDEREKQSQSDGDEKRRQAALERAARERVERTKFAGGECDAIVM